MSRPTSYSLRLTLPTVTACERERQKEGQQGDERGEGGTQFVHALVV